MIEASKGGGCYGLFRALFFFVRCRMTLKIGRNGLLGEPEAMQKDLGQSDPPSRRYGSTKSATLRFSPNPVEILCKSLRKLVENA